MSLGKKSVLGDIHTEKIDLSVKTLNASDNLDNVLGKQTFVSA